VWQDGLTLATKVSLTYQLASPSQVIRQRTAQDILLRYGSLTFTTSFSNFLRVAFTPNSTFLLLSPPLSSLPLTAANGLAVLPFEGLHTRQGVLESRLLPGFLSLARLVRKFDAPSLSYHDFDPVEA